MSNKDWLILSIATFLTMAAWTIYDVYHAAVQDTISEPRQQILEPLDPTLDTSLFEILNARST